MRYHVAREIDGMDNTTTRDQYEDPSTPTDADAAQGPVDFDIYCLRCGYNLRGLSGDPIRCPECGDLNPRGDASIPAAHISGQLRRLESSLAGCVALLLVALPFQIMFWMLLARAQQWAQPVGGLLAYPGIPAFLPLIMWLPVAQRFKATCRGAAGWLGLLIRYHVLGLAAGTAIVAPTIALFLLGTRKMSQAVPCAMPFIALAVVYVTVRPIHARLMVGVHKLQREVAVEILREESRRREHRGLNWSD